MNTVPESVYLEKAAVEYMLRQRRKQRPTGYSGSDGLWIPEGHLMLTMVANLREDGSVDWLPGNERQACCGAVKTYYQHCLSYEHIGNRYGVSPEDLRAEVGRMRKNSSQPLPEEEQE